MGKRKYNTEEEKLQAHREAQKRYVEKFGKEKYNEYQKKQREKKVYDKTWYEKNKVYNKTWHEKNKVYNKTWYEKNKENKKKYSKEYKNTPLGRAHNLLASYKRSDKKHNRGECTLTAKWIAKNIFTKKCQYCGETDWHKLGCDRIDNNLPHTIENVVPCCFHCNCKKH